jgi:putative ABC transport system permease protein
MRILKSIIRNLVSKPITSSINLLGLSISLAIAIILSVYCYSELTSDMHHNDVKNSYIYVCNNNPLAPSIIKNLIDNKHKEIVEVCRTSSTRPPLIISNNNDANFKINNGMVIVDKNFFDIYNCKLLEGDLKLALEEPMKVIIKKGLANKLFGNQTAVGKTIKLDNKHLLTVAAVVEQEKSSFFHFDIISSLETKLQIQPYAKEELSSWKMWNNLLFIKTRPNIDTKKLANTIKSYYPKLFSTTKSKVELVPIDELYFSKLKASWVPYFVKGDKQKVLTLSLVSILILLIAIINFINISTYQWFDKIKQTGTMKVFGAGKLSIIKRMSLESIFLSIISLIIGIILVPIIDKFVLSYTGIKINLNNILSPRFLFIFLSATIILALIISVLPAYKIAVSNVVNNLNKQVNQYRGNLIQKILVSFQFTIAIILIAFTLLINKQIEFGSSNLGFDEDLSLAIKLDSYQGKNKQTVITNYLKSNPKVSNYTFTGFYPNKKPSKWRKVPIETQKGKKEVDFNIFSSDPNLFDVMGLELKQGRFFTDSYNENNFEVVVNECFLKEHNISDPIGCKILGRKMLSKKIQTYIIVGVINDFHFKSVNEKISPLVIGNMPWSRNYCILKANNANPKKLVQTSDKIKNQVNKLSTTPVEVTFLSQAIKDMYKSENQFKYTFIVFSISAIFICVLGIFAISLFSCQKRTKEIGIRKVNGATILNIIKLINSKFIKLLILSGLIGTPLAYYLMNLWLKNYAYKTDIEAWLFIFAGIMTLLTALTTISLQSWHVANKNPIAALKYE